MKKSGIELDETELLVSKIVEGIQEKKGEKIVTVNMTQLENNVFRYFLICEGRSTTHVGSIADSVKDYVREQIRVKPMAVDGYENALWIALDYGDVIVHVFQPETRAFYSIETLWEDADVQEIPELF
jgi:ribosome-associated protein